MTAARGRGGSAGRAVGGAGLRWWIGGAGCDAQQVEGLPSSALLRLVMADNFDAGGKWVCTCQGNLQLQDEARNHLVELLPELRGQLLNAEKRFGALKFAVRSACLAGSFKRLQVVEGMSTEQQRVLLFFWTSVKYLPVDGFSGLASKLYIYKTSDSHDRLPTSHTCFYRLCLPEYPSLPIMRKQLQFITQEHVGCSFGTW
ncbi:hypothetical protein Taro_037803 [Colocasia esculenta]|uniref:HECT-type E3 ubiquitin transferase n=1 Tax=Colocasia esculenta TaxID=4460 RepID=A0A843WAU9_COLES|nr:hypothetical protein [Colocasia esculenta]